MHFLPEKLDNYVVAHSQEEPKVLQELTKETWQKVLNPRMLSGAFQGRILSMITKIIQPKNILEIGTYTGYSALCLAEGLPSEGKIITIDKNEELEPICTKYFNESTYKDQIILHTGNALDVIPQLNKPFDLVFIDADKENYSNYFDLIIDQMPSGGIIIADNVLWSGKVLDKLELEKDMETKALHEFNQKIHQDTRVENVLFPVRDGLMVIRKK
jgi:predicted O-methyltransferase YrrM